MSFKNATKFYHACESLKGWEGCHSYVEEGAEFIAQVDSLTSLKTVEMYTQWLQEIGSVTLKGCRYELHHSSYDESSNTAIYFGTFTGRHVGDGGPVPATNKQTMTHYVYVIEMNQAGKIIKVTKIWNLPWAMMELGWN